MDKTSLVITAGDPAGIGYEEACKFFLDPISKKYDIALIGHNWIVEKTFKDVLKKKMPSHMKVINIDDNKFKYSYGEHNIECGKAAMHYIEHAVKGCLDGKYDAIITCPINKKSIKEAGYNFPGHTEYLGFLSDTKNVSMMLAGTHIKTILATTHLPLKDVPKALTEEVILRAIQSAHDAGIYFGKKNPKIAVCGLNPHSGDNGAIGTEEINLIIPSIDKAKELGLNAYGPFPADTIYTKTKEYDFIIAMYHDQGMIPVKVDSFGEAVNVTLNLPFIRTSVDHGTAFDIAGHGVAKYSSLVKAIDFAANMVKFKKSHKE